MELAVLWPGVELRLLELFLGGESARAVPKWRRRQGALCGTDGRRGCQRGKGKTKAHPDGNELKSSLLTGATIEGRYRQLITEVELFQKKLETLFSLIS